MWILLTEQCSALGDEVSCLSCIIVKWAQFHLPFHTDRPQSARVGNIVVCDVRAVVGGVKVEAPSLAQSRHVKSWNDPARTSHKAAARDARWPTASDLSERCAAEGLVFS